MSFPKDAAEAASWSHIVRFIKLDDEDHETYKYCRHVFKTQSGQGPYIDKEGKVSERRSMSMAFCLGSPRNPFAQGDDLEMDDEGVADCRSIILPNGTSLHDIDEGGSLRERCVVWSWTNNHVAMIDRPVGFFDNLFEWTQKVQDNPFYYSKSTPGFDVLLQAEPKGGNFYSYSFSCPPNSANRDFAAVMHLVKAQRDEVLAMLNPAQTKEDIIQRLGLGTSSPRSSGGKDFDSPGGSKATNVMDDDDELSNMNEDDL